VVLIDFWATWCGPCMQEMPNVLKIYQEFHGKGLEIIGISLDEKRSALNQVIKKQNIPWPQYFDGKGWDNPIVQKFGIDSIPRMWLVNKKGMVVDLDAMDGLEDKIERMIAE
jgi:thiol-disulfide isomerase/thioredoxin